MAIKPPTDITPMAPLQGSGRTEQAGGLAQMLALAPGGTLNARVEQITLATPEEREVLLNRTLKALMTLSRAPTDQASTKSRFNMLLEQQQLLNSPLLQLAKLRVAPHQILVVYTDKPLQTGQPLALQMSADNRLLLHNPLEPVTATRPAMTNTHTPAEPATPRELLASALRVLLPQKDQPDLLPALGTLRQLPAEVRSQTFSPGLNQALDNLLRQIRNPQQLANPEQLKISLQNSGVFFEQKLNSMRTATDVPPTLNTRTATQDIKGALLQVLHRIQQELPPGSQHAPQAATVNTAYAPAPAQPPTSTATTGLPTAPAVDLLQLLFQLPGKPRAELSDRVLRTQLMLLMQQHTLASLAKVQLQQLHTVNHQQAQADSPQPTQSWSFELPVRLGQEARTLEFKIDEQWQEQQNEAGESQRKRRWTVTLNFDLAETGRFHAQLNVIDNQVSARLWAEREATLEVARARLDKLRTLLQDQGLEVTSLQCLDGTPPNKTVSLSYALVDIKT